MIKQQPFAKRGVFRSLIGCVLVAFFNMHVSGTDKMRVLDAIDVSIAAFQTIRENPDHPQWPEIENQLMKIHAKKLWIRDYMEHSENLYEKLVSLSDLTQQTAEAVKTQPFSGTDGLSAFKVVDQIMRAIEEQIQLEYDGMNFKKQMANMLPYIQSRQLIRVLHVNIIEIMVYALSAADPIPDLESWKILESMLDQVHFDDSYETEFGLSRLETALSHLISAAGQLKDQTEPDYFSHLIEKVRKQQKTCNQRIVAFQEKQRQYARNIHEKEDFVSRDSRIDSVKIASAYEWFQRGREARNPADQIEAYTHALEIDSTYFSAFVNRGIAYQQSGKLHLALQDFNAALKLRTDYADIYAYRAEVLESLNQSATALSDYSMAISLDSANSGLYYKRAQLYSVQNELQRALDDIKHALSIDTSNQDYLYLRADIYRKSGKTVAAIADYNRLIASGADSASIYYTMGCIYWDNRKWTQAAHSFQRCLEVDSDYSNAAQWLRYAKQKEFMER